MVDPAIACTDMNRFMGKCGNNPFSGMATVLRNMGHLWLSCASQRREPSLVTSHNPAASRHAEPMILT